MELERQVQEGKHCIDFMTSNKESMTEIICKHIHNSFYSINLGLYNGEGRINALLDSGMGEWYYSASLIPRLRLVGYYLSRLKKSDIRHPLIQ